MVSAFSGLKIIPGFTLVSMSPRRRELLGRIVPNLKVTACDVDETVDASIDPGSVPILLAKRKALAYLESSKIVTHWILTADTVVLHAITGQIMGKPTGRLGAIEMLKAHFGHTHKVITGLCLVDCQHEKWYELVDEAGVGFKDLDQIPENVIDAYLDLQPPQGPYDKAGAYGVQEPLVRDHMIQSVTGDMDTVIGFPSRTFVSLWTQLNAADLV